MERDFFPTAWAVLGNGIKAVVLGGFSGFMGYAFLSRGAVGGLWFAGLAVLMGGWAVSRIRQYRENRPAISVTEDGILDRTFVGSPVFIPWRDIRSVSGHAYGTRLELREESDVRISGFRRFIDRFFRGPGKGHALPTGGLKTHHADVDRFLREWHESLQLQGVKEGAASLTPGSEGRQLSQ